MNIDLTQGWGDQHNYKLFKFPDNSIKFELKELGTTAGVYTTLRTNDDIIALIAVANVLDQISCGKVLLRINYMMYQQDDRMFSRTESFGLKMISKIINSLEFERVEIFHPHSDKVEFIDNVKIIDNTSLIADVLVNIPGSSNMMWVVPDEGAFKTQFKQIQKFAHPHFLTSLKSRDHATGEITTILSSTEDLKGRGCLVIDDISLGARTHINIAKKLKELNAGKLYLIISHGVFNMGVEHILVHYDEIHTTDSICTTSPVLDENSHRLVIHPLNRILA